MRDSDRIRRMLAEAGVESAIRRPAEVIDLPVRSRFLAATAPAAEASSEPAPEPHTGWIRHLPKVGEYLGFACVAVTLLMIASGVRKTLILADVGRTTCATLAVADTPEAAVYWTEDDPGSSVPQMRATQVVACMQSTMLF